MDLTRSWFESDSRFRTIANLIGRFDAQYLKTVTKPTLERDLKREVLFLSIYDKTDEKNIVEYIHNNIDEWFNIARKSAP